MKRIIVSVMVAVALLTTGMITSSFTSGMVGIAYADGDGGAF